jgi:Protein of unknown function (DUF1302)
MARFGRTTRGRGTSAGLLVLLVALALPPPVRATLKYGPIQLSGSVDSQTLGRANEIDEWQFIQNRNTALLRLDYEWFQNGKLIDRLEIPFVKRSNLYVLYRGVYDSFWGIAPGGAQKGVTRYDDRVGGPINGPVVGESCRTADCICPPNDPNCTLQHGVYSRLNSEARTSLAFENTLREAYIDLALTDAPLSFRLGRQQVIWGESDQFRLMDIINPLDTTWHLQQEEWDKIRIPLWLFKMIWDMGSVGPISNAFAEVVWNPGDFVPGNKIHFLPAPWAIPIANPLRAGQIQVADPNSPDTMLSPVFDLQGTSFLRGKFNRNVADASDIGVRFHGVTDIPLVNMQGFEFTANYLYARGRGIGAVAGAPFVVRINKVTVNPTQTLRQNPDDPTSPPAIFAGKTVIPANVTAEVVHPYTHIFGATANWFEGNWTNTVFRLETAYQLNAPFQSAALEDRVNIEGYFPGLKAPVGTTSRDVWAGMVGFDRPTWIKFLNPRTTWFLTGQLFWSYVNGSHSNLRGGILTASDIPYYKPPEGNPNFFWNANTTNGFGQWYNGPYAGQIERTQTACVGDPKTAPGSPCAPGTGVANTLHGNADKFLQWEMLMTVAATSFYLGGTVVPFFAVAIDPMNRNFLAQLKCDFFVTNNLIFQPQAKFFNDLGSGRASLDPWGAGGLNARRDEVGLKVTYQF